MVCLGKDQVLTHIRHEKRPRHHENKTLNAVNVKGENEVACSVITIRMVRMAKKERANQ